MTKEKLDEMEARVMERFRIARDILEKDEEIESPHREWLRSFTLDGVGLDICCGDFPIGNAMGIDQRFVCGVFEGVGSLCADDLSVFDDNSVDYIVTNYLEGTANTQHVLHEWKRILKPKKPLAICAVNPDNYEGPLGVFRNRNRLTAFTPKLLSNHLHRAGYVDVVVEEVEEVIRAKGYKP